MSSTVKVKLHKLANGELMVDIEGTFEEASKLLERYWAIVPETTGSEAEAAEHKKIVPKAGKKNSRQKTASTGKIADHSVDENEWANKIKQDKKFDVFTSKILHTDDLDKKIDFIFWYAGDINLNSGNIVRILEQLGVKVQTSNVSTKLDKNKTKFIVSAERGPGNSRLYKMTSIERSKFSSFIAKDDNGSND